mmetsp:Transcript_18583/g.32323  ORF Transcript_18583/g.32323 Transcript_18583/m.32323 type:complete len:97 (-) Transcript_18583:1157-1447(-)
MCVACDHHSLSMRRVLAESRRDRETHCSHWLLVLANSNTVSSCDLSWNKYLQIFIAAPLKTCQDTQNVLFVGRSHGNQQPHVATFFPTCLPNKMTV